MAVAGGLRTTPGQLRYLKNDRGKCFFILEVSAAVTVKREMTCTWMCFPEV